MNVSCASNPIAQSVGTSNVVKLNRQTSSALSGKDEPTALSFQPVFNATQRARLHNQKG